MDLTSKNMYDTFKDEIWKELGPLDPDWFDILTAQAFTNEGNVSDPDDLCANQEGNFKTPFDKTGVDSQLFSTPRVFRHSQVVSPETEYDQSFTNQQEKETLPWAATQSPYLLRRSKEGLPGAKYEGIQPQSQDSFDLLHTPKKSPVSYAMHISESLGAQIHPDISWTSSLNTPPAVPSTLILSKTDESPCPVSVSADKNVVFVRKLFPSLSNASRVGALSPKNTDMPTLHQGVVSPEADQKPHDSLNQSEAVWRQKLPDAVEEGETCSAVASVLDEAENVLSVFFTNSSSALRKVKTERIKRKQIVSTKEHGCSPTDISTINNAVSSEQRTDEHEPVKCSSPSLVKTRVTEITQWSPLSLSEIPPCTVDTSSHDNSPATQVENSILTELQSDSHSGQLVKPRLTMADSGLTKKKRKFIYTVKTSKTQVQEKEIQSQKWDSSPRIPDFGQEMSVKHLENAQDEAECCSIGENEMQKQENVTEENLPLSVQAKVQDLDMSQLCRDFAQDFSQMSDHGKLSKITEDAPQNGFSPSACLSAMKRAKQKARRAHLHQDYDGMIDKRHVSATNQNFPINEGTVSDSGFQSTFADFTHVTTTSFVLPSSENNSLRQSGFKTDIHRAASFQSTNEGNGNTHLDNILQETDANLCCAIKESQTLDPGKESELHKESISAQLRSSAKGTVDNIDCILLNGNINVSFPEKTTVSLPSIHASGFKTASNKGIRVSSANLEKAKHLFQENEAEGTFSGQLTKSAYDTKDEISLSHRSVKNTISNSNQLLSSGEKYGDVSCHLTASQKADVTELCTLLEEADSQFEFTQVKTAKLKQCQDNATSLQRVDKELDPDFLVGIDFDDSFSSDAEKHLEITVRPDKMTSVSDGKTNCEASKVTSESSVSLSNVVKKENSTIEDLSSSSNHISEASSSIIPADPKNLDKDGYSEISKQENKIPLTVDMGFKTAGGDVLRVSEKYLSKAKALFADLEVNLKDQKTPEIDATEQGQITSTTGNNATKSFKNSKMHTSACQSGFQMASGKGISVSAKAMQDADAFFKDCSVLDNNTGMSVKDKKTIESLLGNGIHKKKLTEFKNVQGMKDFSEESVKEFEYINDGPTSHHSNVVQHNVDIHTFGFKKTAGLTNSFSQDGNPPLTVKTFSSPSCTASKDFGSCAINELSSDGGFCTARGKKVSVSADAVKKAVCLLNEIHTLEDSNKQLKQEGDALRISKLTNQSRVPPPKNSGFQTASGKGVVISSAALKKAKSLLSECEVVVHNISVKPAHLKMSVPGLPHRNNGFLAASGKPVALSAEALQKAKALFSDISFSEDIPAVLDKRNSDKKQNNTGKTDKICCGFMTAGAATVHVSQNNLLKAKNLLKEFDDDSVSEIQEGDAFFKHCDVTDSNNGMSAKYGKTVAPVSESGIEKKNLSIFKPDQRVEINTSQHVEFENVHMGPVVNHENVLHLDDSEIKKGVFKNTQNSANGIPSLMAKPLSSLLCTTSKNIGSPAISEFGSGGGFCTASGKKVSISDDAIQKAKFLLNESAAFEDTNNKPKHNEDTSPPQNSGFQTASGKGVAISTAALKKANTLLSQCERVNDEIGVKPTHSKMPVPRPQPRNGAFHAASGKPVALSAEALQKVKALFSDIGFSAEIPPVSDRNSDKKQNNTGKTDKIHCGFMTAGGATVHVSQNNLLKAKTLLKEFHDDSISTFQEADAFYKDCDITDRNNSMSVKSERSVGSVSESGSEKKNLSKFKPDQRVEINTSVDPGSGCVEFENVHVGPVVNHENVRHLDDVEINTPNSTNGNPSLMTKPLSSLLCTTSKNICSPAFNELSSGGGFCTASGKKVSVSDDAMQKAKFLLNESAAFEDTNKELKSNEDTFPPQNGGFQTASGKGVAITSAALTKAKILLSECERVNDEIGVKPTHSKMPATGPPSRNSGFHAASGKPVALSSEALRQAKALFSDIGFSEEIPAIPETRKSDRDKGAQNSTGEMHCGFTTAGGAKVHVSQKNLLKAKNLLKEFVEGDCHDSNSASPDDIHKTDLGKVKEVKRTSNKLTIASDKDMSAKESVPQVVKSFPSLQETDDENETLHNSSVRGCIYIKEKAPTNGFKYKEGKIAPSGMNSCHDIPAEEVANVLDNEVNRTKSSVASKSSFLIFQSLNLSGCTETQQTLLAQEALDCTKALLEDERLADQSLSVTLENVPLQDNPKSSSGSVEEPKGRGKRSVEDADMTGQPPLKRRLLEEFDRTVDGPRGSTLHAEKSCPKGVMNDRRVFKYSSSLHPNITRPHSNGKNYVETRLQKTTPTQLSAPGDTRSAHSKMPVFVPPFYKNAKTETRKNTVLQDNIRTPAFIPPFKKQRTIVHESSSKAQEEDQHHHVFVTTSNSNIYVPPTKKTQSTESKDDIQTVALADATNDDLMINQNFPVGCGSEDSAAEAPFVENTLSRNQDMFQNLENMELARDMQDMRIRKKKRQNIRPLPGSLFLIKTSGVSRISLKAAVNGKPPARYTQKQLYGYGVHQHVMEITSETAESFRFNLHQFLKQEAFIDCGGVQLADGGWLITSNDGTAGKEEFYKALCDTPGVDSKLISEKWVYNHYRWIVWKQASMERSFPQTMGSLCLTPEQVLLQLKYRYDVEVDHSRRPALRKIMERDDTAAKTLVLCVCGVVSRGQSPNRQSRNDTKTPQGADAKVENPSAVVWLTDGWYAIKAQLDEPLSAMLRKGRLAVGGKLVIHGAQLVGSQDACSPMEAPESLMLKICANSSRPARWDTKLGFYRDPRPFLLPVSCLYSNGGPVGCVDIIILRSYPIQWMERKPDGGVVFRSVRAEEKEARLYNSHKQKAMEILFAKIQAEFEKEEKGNKPQRRRRTISRQDIANLQDGEELHEAVEDDLAYLEAHLSEQQLESLRTYRRTLMEKKQAELQDRYRRALETEDSEGSCLKRDVTPVWRLCIADSMDQSSSVYQLNLWRPSSDLQSLLREGCRYKVFNLTTTDGKKRSGIETIQLTGTKKTQFQHLQASQEWLSARFQPRVSTNFVDLQNTEFQPLCGEVDLTGYVISIIDGQGSSPAFYLADGRLNFIKVRCFSSLSQSGLEDVVKPHVLLALSNLQLRGQSTSPTPVVYAGDLTVFSTNPKEVHLQESLSQLRNLVQSHGNFHLAAEEKLSHLVKSDALSSISSPALQPRTPASTTGRKQDAKTRVMSQQPVRSLGSFTPAGRNPPSATSSTEKDPRSLKRRRALDYLSRIPSPPALSYQGSVASPCVNKTFNPPRRSGTPSTLKTVQTPACKPVNSPVEDEWVNDEELAMIDTQALRVGDVDT